MKIKKINIPAMKIIILLLFSLILSAVVVLGRKFVYSGLIFGSVNDNYIKEFSTGDLLYIILGMIIIGIVIALIAMIYKYLDKKIEISRITIIPKKRRKYILICGIIIFIFWIPYLLNYMPGCIYSDGFNSIGQALYGGYNNHHPILYTLYVKIFIDIGQKFNDLKIGILLYSIMQMVIMSIIMGYFVIWILEQCSSKIYAFLILLFICLNPLFPYYAITLWKDTLFSLALFLYVLMHIDIVQSNGMILTKWKMIIKYCLISLAVAFLRNNGIYIIIFTDVVLIFSFRKLLKTKLKMFLKAVVSMIVMIVIIQGPVYKSLGLTTEFCESVGIPLQQLARTVVCGGEYSAEDGSFINEICSLDYIKEKYTPCVVDSIKWSKDNFNEQFLEEHKKIFLKTWVKLFFDNPKIYFDAFLLENLGYWNLEVSGPEAYVQAGIWPNELNLEQENKLDELFGFSIDQYVYPKKYISSGLLFWMIMIMLMIMMINGKSKMIISFLPIIGLWLTLMIATPIAISLRYTYVMVLLLPLLPIYPLLQKNY